MGVEAYMEKMIDFAWKEMGKYRAQNIELSEKLYEMSFTLKAAESALKVVARGGCCQVCELDCADKGRAAACSAFRWNGRGE